MAVSQPVAGGTGTAHDHGFHPLSVTRVVRETADASSFVLDVPDELRPAFAYEAGQFCTFRVRVDGQAHLRCYSMSSSPTVDPDLTVTVKRTAGGVVSNFLIDQLGEGDSVEVTRPAGVFCLTGGGEDIVAFSAGSGITPVHSLLKSALATTARTVRLFYANRDRDAVIFAADLDALGAAHRDRLVVSHHLDVERGLVTADAVRHFASADWDAQFYVCGPAPFMDVVEQALLDGGVLEDRIHIERFTPTEQVLEPVPPFSTAVGSQVTIELSGRTDSTEHRPGTTILQTARQMGMSPPFSCEAGSCATCMARLVEGTAAMYVNNALTDDEVAEGWVLTCQAVPDSPSVHVVYEDAVMSSAPVDDVTEIAQLLARYALGMTKDDIDSVVEVFTPDGTYSAFGDTYRLEDFPALVAAAPKGLFLVGPAVLEIDGDAGTGQQPLCFVEQTTHDMRIGWYTDTYRRTAEGWRLHTRSMTFLRRNGARDAGRPHDPTRPSPTTD